MHFIDSVTKCVNGNVLAETHFFGIATIPSALSGGESENKGLFFPVRY